MHRLLLSILLSLCLALPSRGDTLSYDVEAERLTEQLMQLLQSGRYVEAEQRMAQACSLEEHVTASYKSQLQAARLRVEIALGDYTDVKRLYREALADSPDEEFDDQLRLIYSEYGFFTGDYDDALSELAKVTTERYLPKSYAHRVRLLTANEQPAEAVALADSVLATMPRSSESYPVMLQNRGYAYWMLGSLQQAESDLSAAVEAMTEGADRYAVMANLAVLQAERGECDAAAANIAGAMAWLDPSSVDGIIAQRKRAEVMARCGDKRAAGAWRDYVEGEKQLLLANLSQMSASQRLNYWAKEKPLLSRSFMLGDDQAEMLFGVAMFRRQTSLLGMRDTTDLKRLLMVIPTQIRKALRRGEAAVEIVSYEPERDRRAYAAIVLPKSGRARMVHLLDESEITKQPSVGTATLIDAVGQENRRTINRLYTDSVWGNRIWQPILGALPADISCIYFAPEGIFHLLGIENLPFDGSERVELHRVTTVASLTNRTKPRDKGAQRALVVGGLNYDRLPSDSLAGDANREAADALKSAVRGSGSVFGYLQGTRDEADSIRALLPKAETRYELSERQIKHEMGQYDVVHIATHGYSLNFGIGRRPEFLADSIPFDRSLIASGLALTGANKAINGDSGDDQLLSARELCDLDLSAVDFVVLSACQTAKGDVNDEGAAGLVRGLKNAGVKTVVATLWSVDDASTMLFMQQLYSGLQQGLTKYEAFRKAQEHVRSYTKRLERHRFSAATLARDPRPTYKEISYSAPYYWAPFILIDD